MIISQPGFPALAISPIPAYVSAHSLSSTSINKRNDLHLPAPPPPLLPPLCTSTHSLALVPIVSLGFPFLGSPPPLHRLSHRGPGPNLGSCSLVASICQWHRPWIATASPRWSSNQPGRAPIGSSCRWLSVLGPEKETRDTPAASAEHLPTPAPARFYSLSSTGHVLGEHLLGPARHLFLSLSLSLSLWLSSLRTSASAGKPPLPTFPGDAHMQASSPS
ncbi:hypothetical protein VTK73DRAFT_2317 [Phialemonium thermophilum]|uniref:Uncharacterized protein n=1 Tax=Phialemonium thermophilum TaxID=223376 RepID=A0ABR3VSB4_9PEZI